MDLSPTKILKFLGMRRDRRRIRNSSIAEKSAGRPPLKWRSHLEDGSPDFVIGSLVTACAVLVMFLIAFFTR